MRTLLLLIIIILESAPIFLISSWRFNNHFKTSNKIKKVTKKTQFSQQKDLLKDPNFKKTFQFFLDQKGYSYWETINNNEICLHTCNKKTNRCLINFANRNKTEQRYREEKDVYLNRYLLPLPYIRSNESSRFDLDVSCFDCGDHTEGFGLLSKG